MLYLHPQQPLKRQPAQRWLWRRRPGAGKTPILSLSWNRDSPQYMSCKALLAQGVVSSKQRGRFLHESFGRFDVVRRLTIWAHEVELIIVVAARPPLPLSLDDR